MSLADRRGPSASRRHPRTLLAWGAAVL